VGVADGTIENSIRSADITGEACFISSEGSFKMRVDPKHNEFETFLTGVLN